MSKCQFKLRRLVAYVALTAAILGAAVAISRQLHRWSSYREKAAESSAKHDRLLREAQILDELAKVFQKATGERSLTREEFQRTANECREAAARAEADYRKYRSLSW